MSPNSVGRTIGKNFGFNILSVLIVRLFNIVILPIQTRFLGPGGYGLLNYALSYASLWAFVADFGFSKSLVRDIAQNRENAGNILGSALIISAAFSSVGIVISSALLWFIRPDDLTAWVGFFIIAASFLSTLNGLITAAFSGLEKMQCNTMLSVTSKCLALVAVISVFIILSRGVLVYSVALSLIGVIQFFISCKYIQKYVGKIPLRPTSTGMKTVLISGAPFLFIGLLGRSSSQIDSVMLMHMLDRDAVGLYQVSYKIVMLLFLLPSSLMDAAYPSIARIYPDSPGKAIHIFTQFSRLMGVFSIPVVLSVYAYSGDIITIIAGSDFAGSSLLLKIQIWICLLAFFAYPMGTLLTCAGFQNDNIAIAFLGAIVNIIGNGILISVYGLNGAVVATLMMGIAILLASFYYVWLHIKSVSFIPPFLNGCFIAIMSLTPYYLLPDYDRLYHLLGGLILWICLAITLKQIRKDDCRALYDFIRGR